MPIKRINTIPKNHGSGYPYGTSRQPSTSSISNVSWDVIRQKTALLIIATTVYDIPKPFSRYAGIAQRDTALHRLSKKGYGFVPSPAYTTIMELAKIIKNLNPEDLKRKRSRTMVDLEKLSFDIKEVINFILNMRIQEELYWWVGVLDPHAEEVELISTSLRGYFSGMLWKPVDDEIAPCCDKILKNLSSEDSQEFNPFIMLEHCTSHEHIEAMLMRRTVEQLEREHQYMLEMTLKALVDAV
jgi:hypothetical protein